MSDVVVTSFAPAAGGGAGLRTLGVVKALAAHGDVTVRYVAHEDRRPDAALQEDPRVTLEQLHPGRGLPRLLSVARTRARGVPTSWARAASPELVGAGRRAAAGDRLIADGPTVAGALLGLAARRPAVYLAHNFEASFRGDTQVARFERRLLQTYSEVWLPTPADVAAARGVSAEDTTLRYVPNVVDVTRITPVTPGPADPPTALLVADFTYPPNADALSHLTDTILPAAWATEPRLRVLVAGRGIVDPPADPRVQALGFVADLDEVYRQAHAVVVPLRVGGGSPLKFVEALAHGLPVVATPHAAALLDRGVPGQDFLVGDGEEFAAHLVDAVRGAHAGTGARGRALATREYSVEALSELMTWA